ncbi:MAG: hypothetical protein CL927_15640 [Deltaproteobacteria bacterium]|nr:hypothetical protein [Deltaproteobacteria bacterium]HCH65083.1 hypothetical protein [Deltaproteobacteria bacterium]
MPQVFASNPTRAVSPSARSTRTVLTAAVLPLSLAGASTARAEDAPTILFPANAAVETLDNGLQMVLLPVDTPGIATIETWMRVGSGEETVAGLTGFAHFFEHLMFHGSDELPKEVREQKLLELSVTENAWTSQDATVYHLVLPAQNLAEVLTVESDRFRNLTLEAEGVRKEAGAVYGEFRKGRTSPDRAVWEATWATAYRSHPYHHSTIGIEDDIAAMPEQLAAARRFFTTWYRPENATVVIAGDIDPAQARALVGTSFGSWSPEPIPEPWPVAPVEPEQDGLRRAQVVWEAGPVNPRLVVAWRTPAYAPGTLDGAALSLLPALLASDVSPLHRTLVADEQRARWIYAEAPDHRHPGLFTITLELAEGEDPSAIEAEVLAAVSALATDDSPDAERRLEMTRARNRRERLLSLDSAHRWASAYGRSSLYGPVPNTLQGELDAASRVQLADVSRVVHTWLLPDAGRTVVTLVGPDRADPNLPPPPIGPEVPVDGGEQ